MGDEVQEQTVFEQLEQQNMSREDYLTILQARIDEAEKMKQIVSQQNFIDLFETKYIKDFAVASVQNMSSYKPETRVRVNEKIVARSVFSKFIEQVLSDGDEGRTAMAEFREAEKLELEQSSSEAS